MNEILINSEICIDCYHFDFILKCMLKLTTVTVNVSKNMFSVIKFDLLAVFNHIKNSKILPNAMKEGIIVLIPKGEGILAMENYRGITLNNVDLKI